MGTTTTNFGLYKPDIGETGWGTLRNASYDTIDTQLQLGTVHRASDGSDHTFIDQDVTIGAAPVLDGTNFTNISVTAANVSIVDAGGFLVATDVEAAFQEIMPEVDANTAHAIADGKSHSDVVLNNTHRVSDGSDHTFLDQSVTIGAAPSLLGTNITVIPAASILAGTFGTGAFVFDSTVSGITTMTSTDLSDGTTTLSVTEIGVATINFIMDGGGAVIATGTKGLLEIPFSCTINSWVMVADQSCTATMDVNRDTFAGYAGTPTSIVGGSSVPTITAALKNNDTDVTDWTSDDLTAGDILEIDLDTNDNATFLTLSLKVTKV